MSDLIDRQALKNKICDCCEGKDEWCNGPCFEIMIIDSMQAFTSVPWHRVEEEPKEEKRYLVWEADGFAYCDTWKDGKWQIASSVPETNISHWMPIEPPKEETK